MMKIEKQPSFNSIQDLRGFTLIEVLLIVAIFIIILSSAISLINTQIFENDLSAKTLEVSTLLETARNHSASGYRGDVWSIKVLDSDVLCNNSGDCILLFKGNDFSGRDTSYDRFVQFDQNVSGVYINADQENEFYFDYKSGWLSTSTAARLDHQNIVLSSNFGEQKSVVVYPSGVVASFTCGEDKVFDSQGNAYFTIKIGTQCWMAENLNIGTMIAAATAQSDNSVLEKWCYDGDVTNCDDEGGLYDWDELMNYITPDASVEDQSICPGGWHVPLNGISNLAANYPANLAGYNLKIGGPSGFNLPMNGKMDSGLYNGQGTLATLWTSFDGGDENALIYLIDDNVDPDDIDVEFTTEEVGHGARCLKDY